MSVRVYKVKGRHRHRGYPPLESTFRALFGDIWPLPNGIAAINPPFPWHCCGSTHLFGIPSTMPKKRQAIGRERALGNCKRWFGEPLLYRIAAAVNYSGINCLGSAAGLIGAIIAHHHIGASIIATHHTRSFNYRRTLSPDTEKPRDR